MRVGELREGGDRAQPLVAVQPNHPASLAFKEIAAKVIQQLNDKQANVAAAATD
jgi:MinD-like ATPase involved in chromosome partitioning or flagellar assembly